MTDAPRKIWVDPTGVDELDMYVAHASDTMDHLNMDVEYIRADTAQVMHVSFARENMVAQARIQKLEQQLDWFARGKFINEWDNVQEMVERVRRRALGAIKYLADE
jgi:hypothetical protein